MIENHPFEPWLPKNAHLLMLGTFPPSPKRWCIPWYYPNFQNDMWRIFGIIFFGDKLHFVDVEHKQYRLEAIKEFLGEKGVALFDTAQKVIRTKNTASDKDLKIVELSDLDGMLRALPECKAVLTAGQLATKVSSTESPMWMATSLRAAISSGLITASACAIMTRKLSNWRRCS